MSKEYWLSSPETSDMFERVASEVFSFIKADYAFKVVNTAKDGFGCRINFCNQTTGIQINYEPGNLRIWVVFFRLLDGKWPEYQLTPIPGYKSDYFYLEDIMVAKESRIQSSKLYATAGLIEMGIPITEEYITEKLKLIAGCVNTYAKELLTGDFSVFSDAQKLLDDRVRRASAAAHTR